MRNFLATTAAVLVSLLFLVSPLQASEIDSFPARHSDLAPSFARYADLSRAALTRLDTLAASGQAAASEWSTVCLAATNELEKARIAALAVCRRNGSEKLPVEVDTWTKLEFQAWKNVKKIGTEIITLHDQVLETTALIEKKLLPEHRTRVGKIKVAAKAADQLAGEVVGYGNGVGPATDTAMEGITARAIEDVGRLLSGINTINQELAARLEQFETLAYASQLERLASEDIDPDAKGTFFEHERRWETSLNAALKLYNTAYQNYTSEVNTLQSYEILAGYTYLKSMPRTPKEAQLWLQAKAAKGKAENPAATPLKSGDIYLTTRRVPTELQVGEEAIFEVMVNNRGDSTLPAGWTLDCQVVTAPPGGAKSAFAYRTGKGPELSPGKAVRVTQRVEAPVAVGNWVLNWSVRRGTDEIAEASGKVKVNGAVAVELGDDSLRGTRFRQGDREDVKIEVSNTGDIPIDPANLSVQIAVKRTPSGYRATAKDFSLLLRPRSEIAPGRTGALSGNLTAPTDPKALGNWQLEILLKLDGRVTERRTVDVKVESR